MFVQTLSLSEAQLSDLFLKLQATSGAVYLDSAATEHDNSNFSVFAWQPKFVLQSTLDSTDIWRGDELIESSNADPLSLIEKYLAKLSIEKTDLPFYGGAIGYWDYELGGRFESLPQPRESDISLPNMYVGIYDTAIVIEHGTEHIQFVSQAFDAEQRLSQLQSSMIEPDVSSQVFSLTSSWQSNMTKPEYSEKFGRVQEYLLSGDCYQINLAQRFSASYKGDEWQAYLQLRAQNAAPFSSFMRLPQGAVLSVSPERFLQVIDNRVETKPIKGTRPRSIDPKIDEEMASDLRQAEKDRAENLMIVDLLRNDLSKVAVPGTVEVPSLFAIESFPAVHHLVSTVTAQIRPPFTSLDLLRGAFPGGSITGAPKIRAMQIIHELEPTPRSVYCGAIGYITPEGNMDTNITIRTLVCNKNKIHCWAGGGLVADSDCDSEYQETLDKVNKILPVLSNMN